MPKHRSPENLLENIQSILPIIKQKSDASERLGRVQEEVLDALFQQRVFRLFIPEKYHGEPTDLPTALNVFESIASADGATGWLAMIGAGGGLFSGFLEEQAAYEIFSPERALIAGSGMPSGEATTLKNGFEVSGRWRYASGSDYASWFTANCKVGGDDDEILSIAVPADDVTVDHTWDVFGMKATGSHDFSIDSVCVAKTHTFSLANTPLLDDSIFFCPLETLASLSFGSVALGTAQHAVEEFISFAKQKPIKGASQFLMAEPSIQQHCTQAQSALNEVRNRLYQRAEQVWKVAEKRRLPSDELREQVTEEVVEMVQRCVHLVDALKARSGMMAVFMASPFGRAWRDLHTLSQHVIVSSKG
uniref:Acyl-CoA dehydrogenase family protein n=1 Tax=Hydrogenovibrio crunogenus (strain DSM 25203 / XCL-2) TaxID=317025 RepID=Q31GV8_HYDCU